MSLENKLAIKRRSGVMLYVRQHIVDSLNILRNLKMLDFLCATITFLLAENVSLKRKCMLKAKL